MPSSAAEPLISLVLPTFNAERFLAESIESCLNQTHRRLEVIVVDGGSTDGTLDIVQSYARQDPRVSVQHQPANLGRLPGALNLGFAAAAGEFFTWMQSDDYYAPEALAVMLERLRREPAVGLVYTGYDVIDEQGQRVGRIEAQPPEAIFSTNPVGTCFLYRRQVARQIGDYDVRYLMAEDVHYWTRIYRDFKMAAVPGAYFAHRLHPRSLTVDNYGRYWALRVAARARRNVLGLPWRQYQKQVAAAYIEEAFAVYADNRLPRTRRCLALGLLRDPAWLRNRGVLSMAASALLGRHAAHRVRQLW